MACLQRMNLGFISKLGINLFDHFVLHVDCDRFVFGAANGMARNPAEFFLRYRGTYDGHTKRKRHEPEQKLSYF